MQYTIQCPIRQAPQTYATFSDRRYTSARHTLQRNGVQYNTMEHHTVHCPAPKAPRNSAALHRDRDDKSPEMGLLCDCSAKDQNEMRLGRGDGQTHDSSLEIVKSIFLWA